MEIYNHAVAGMTEEEERLSLRNYVEASQPGEAFTMNHLTTGLKDRPQKRLGPNKRGVNKCVITSAGQPFGPMPS